MDNNTVFVEVELEEECAVESAVTVDRRDAKIARLAAAWDRALVELFAERAVAA